MRVHKRTFILAVITAAQIAIVLGAAVCTYETLVSAGVRAIQFVALNPDEPIHAVRLLFAVVDRTSLSPTLVLNLGLFDRVLRSVLPLSCVLVAAVRAYPASAGVDKKKPAKNKIVGFVDCRCAHSMPK